jgi:5'(3')-deoxyribonucleotidase
MKLDIDGVLRDINTTFCKLLLEQYNYKVDYNDFNCYWFTNTIMNDLPNFNSKKFMIDNKIEIFGNSKPYYENIEILDKLSEKYKIKIVSAQFNETEKITDKWLNKYKILKNVDEVIYTTNKKAIKGDFLVDDCIHNLFYKNDICVARPWNKCGIGLFRRINKLEELL